MASISGATYSTINKFRISRRGRKLQATEDQRTLIALPRDVPERIWAEVLQKEDNDSFIFEIREDIIEEALSIGYENYMKKQTTFFTSHCTAQAWLKLIDWHFYRHDPGEDPSANPPCFIPKRQESWNPDELPDPSPKDTWCKHELNVIEDMPDEVLLKWSSKESLDLPLVEEISSEYWFPGKIHVSEDIRRGITRIESLGSVSGRSSLRSSPLQAESEVLQKVTDYSTEELLPTDSNYSVLKTTTPVERILQEAGDTIVDRLRPKKKQPEKSKVFSRPSFRSRASLPPLEMGDSHISIISDCRLRNLRLETQYEMSSEKIDTPPGETVKRK